ncbi:hypothetical protein [Paenibacillus tepidiphilus]|uniref:hypothetical protein n=1 Tax=Paenibacillus tepidiphilus TaxID=2608683 RepID=UPI00123A108B|nr:hypothetical protein [Paenibacillus tepidiphilus]
MSAPIKPAGRSGRRSRRRSLGLLAALAAVLAAAGGYHLLARPDRQAGEAFSGLPHRYAYASAEAPGGVRLHIMTVQPEDIELRAVNAPLRGIAAYGINGGFFYGTDLLSVAIVDDAPVAGTRGAYGSGWFNAKYARGTLVWDGAEDKLSVQVVSSGDDIAVADRSRYWAQGGISMNLQRGDLWAAAAEAEHLPFAADKRLRSGLVYDAGGQLQLIVTDTLSTAEEFRSAILSSIPGEGLEGIFLDGDGSSQMNADEAVLPGDSRPVVQMIALRGEE